MRNSIESIPFTVWVIAGLTPDRNKLMRFTLPTLRLSIRAKLVLVSTTLLIIPWVGSQYVQEMEDYLRQQQQEAILIRAQTVASVLQGRPDLFTIQSNSPLPTRDVQHLFVRPLQHPMQLDGYLDDWSGYENRIQHIEQSRSIFGNEASTLRFDIQVGSYQKYLYVAMKVFDRHIVYRQPGSNNLERSDHVIIAMENTEGEFVNYVITTSSPGWVNTYRRTDANPEDEDSRHYEREVRIKGDWQEFKGGYTVELRIPVYLIGSKISFAVADVNDAKSRNIDSIIATAGINEASALATIIFPSPEVEQLLNNLQRPLTRTWVIDRNYRVIAQTGALTTTDTSDDTSSADPANKPHHSMLSGMMSFFYSLILKQPSNEFHDELLNASRLDSEEFRQALQGKPTTRWRQTPDKETSILTAAHPVFSNGQVIGAIAIEQTSNSILLLQNRAMEILFNISALAFLSAIVVLLAFATRLTSRIRHLRDAAEHAITPDGRVTGAVNITTAGDEIGDLSRSIADMLARLSQYNRYLETMASKLSHELRTPITVVRSSLDNLEVTSMPAAQRTYIERATDGIHRLNDILTRMSEATRLEQTLQSEQRSEFDIAHVVRSCVAGYRLAHPEVNITLTITPDLPDTQIQIRGVPELIAQMLDKLVNNAIDFHLTGTKINLELQQDDGQVKLYITNQGPTLPAAMKSNVFDSMVSVRQQRDEQPHLGLGLYIVRLIVEFHQGTVRADNLANNTGVGFTIHLPCKPA